MISKNINNDIFDTKYLMPWLHSKIKIVEKDHDERILIEPISDGDKHGIFMTGINLIKNQIYEISIIGEILNFSCNADEIGDKINLLFYNHSQKLLSSLSVMNINFKKDINFFYRFKFNDLDVDNNNYSIFLKITNSKKVLLHKLECIKSRGRECRLRRSSSTIINGVGSRSYSQLHCLSSNIYVVNYDDQIHNWFFMERQLKSHGIFAKRLSPESESKSKFNFDLHPPLKREWDNWNKANNFGLSRINNNTEIINFKQWCTSKITINLLEQLKKNKEKENFPYIIIWLKDNIELSLTFEEELFNYFNLYHYHHSLDRSITLMDDSKSLCFIAYTDISLIIEEFNTHPLPFEDLINKIKIIRQKQNDHDENKNAILDSKLNSRSDDHPNFNLNFSLGLDFNFDPYYLNYINNKNLWIMISITTTVQQLLTEPIIPSPSSVSIYSVLQNIQDQSYPYWLCFITPTIITLDTNQNKNKKMRGTIMTKKQLTLYESKILSYSSPKNFKRFILKDQKENDDDIIIQDNDLIYISIKTNKNHYDNINIENLKNTANFSDLIILDGNMK